MKASVKAFFNTAARTYDDRFGGKAAIIENELVTANLPTRDVLDLGCGTGLYLDYCRPSGYIGVDLSAGMLAVARAKFADAKFIQSDMSGIPLPDNSFDAVVSLFGSFSYCLTPHRCVDEINRVLRPDGRVVGKAIGEVLPVLRSEKPPSSSEDCEWCRYAKLLKVLS